MCPPDGSRPTVLIVEDEPNLRNSVVRGLSRALDARVLGAGTIAEARSALDATPPSVLVSDIDLPDGTGLELFKDLDDRGLKTPIIVVSAYVRHYQGRIPTRPGVEAYEKPLPLEQLKRVVERALTQVIPQDTSPFIAADYLQLAGIGRKSVLIEVRTPRLSGTIQVHAGSVVSANDSRGDGMPAFRRLVFANGDVRCRSLRPAEIKGINLEGSCEELLMEAARQDDEAEMAGDTDAGWSTPPPRFASYMPGARSSSVPPSRGPRTRGSAPPSSRTPASQRAPKVFDDLYALGVEALISRRYAEAFDLLRQAQLLRPDDSRVNANLARLSTLLAQDSGDS